MSVREILAGRAVVELGIRSRIEAGLKAARARLSKFSTNLTTLGRGTAAFGGALVGAGGAGVVAMTGLARAFAASGDDVQKMGIRLGASADYLTELAFAAQQSGTSIETVSAGIFRMNRRVANATTQTGPAVRALEELGISAERLETMSTEERFAAIADALNSMGSETRAAQLGFEMFGDSYRSMLPLLREGSSGMAALRQEARDLGATMSQDDAEAAAKLTDALGRFSSAMKGITIQIGAALAPTLTRMVTAFAQGVGQVVAFIRENRELIKTVFSISTAVAGIGIAFVAAGGVIIGLGATIAATVTIISTAFTVLGAIVATITSPITIVLAAVAGLGYLALEASGGLTKLSEMFDVLGSTAQTAWGGIVAAISSGDLETAGEIAFLTLEVAYNAVMIRLKQVWADLTFFLQSAWRGAIEGIIDTGAAIYFGVARYFDLLSNALIAGFDIAFIYIRGAIDGITTAIAKAIISAQEFFGLFSEEQGQAVRDSLDRDLERRAAGRQAGLDSRAAGRGAALDQRQEDRQATARDFANAIEQQLRTTRTQVNSGELSAAEERLAERTAALQEKAAGAQEKAAKQAEQTSSMPLIPEGLLGQLQTASANGTAQTRQLASSGTFSAAAALAIGVGAKPQEQTAKNTAALVTLARRQLKKPAGGAPAFDP